MRTQDRSEAQVADRMIVGRRDGLFDVVAISGPEPEHQIVIRAGVPTERKAWEIAIVDPLDQAGRLWGSKESEPRTIWLQEQPPASS